MSENFTGGLNFTWPANGDPGGWASTVEAALTAISSHTHDGGSLGAPLAASSTTDAAIRLRSQLPLRARNAAGTGDVNLLQTTSGDLLSILTVLVFGQTPETITATGTTAVSIATAVTILNKASGAGTLADGVAGQIKLIVNINSTSCTVTPATTAGTNTAALAQNGAVLYIFLSGEWRAFAGAGCTLS